MLAALVGVAMLGCGLKGPVRPWQRGTLSHRSMDQELLPERVAEDFCGHVFDIREGATGGLGRPGGGCGCN